MSNHQSPLKPNQSASELEEQLGKKIKQARSEIGMSQKELGKALRLSDKTISAYEVGRALPGIKILQDLSRVTQRPIGYFLDEPEYQDLDLQLKIKQIEQELLAVKQLLKKRG